jgi:hypothetical protein
VGLPEDQVDHAASGVSRQGSASMRLAHRKNAPPSCIRDLGLGPEARNVQKRRTHRGRGPCECRIAMQLCPPAVASMAAMITQLRPGRWRPPFGEALELRLLGRQVLKRGRRKADSSDTAIRSFSSNRPFQIASLHSYGNSRPGPMDIIPKRPVMLDGRSMRLSCATGCRLLHKRNNVVRRDPIVRPGSCQ